MSESKTFIVGDGGTSSGANVLSTLAPLLQQRGVDPSVLAMLNNNGGFGNNGGWFVWILFLALLGWGNGGFGGWGNNNGNGAGFLSNQISNSEGRDLLMQSIQGNKDAINNLATTLNTDFQTVSNGINTINTQLCSIGKDVGMTGMQVINAIQQGNQGIIQQLCNSFGQINLGMCQQTNALQNAICNAKGDIKNGLTMLGFQGERQTNTLTQAINASTQRIVDGQTQAQIRELEALLANKDTQIARLEGNAATQQIVNNALAPIIATLNQVVANQNAGGGDAKATA